jgi:lysophospholipase L1-like esterase
MRSVSVLFSVVLATQLFATETNNVEALPPGEKKNSLPLLDTAATSAGSAKKFTVFMIGDSTMANKPVIPANPERGWGQLLPLYFKAGVSVENHAMNGRSSKSFINEGRWQVVAERLHTNDWVIIQFGHNDQKGKAAHQHTEPAEFKTNLVMYITQALAHGANPVLCTSIARRKFDAQGGIVADHADHIVATREVAAEQGVPLLDLFQRTEAELLRLGPERSKLWFDWVSTNDIPQLKKNLEDDTHLNAFGASRVCDLAVEELRTVVPALAKSLNAK